MVSGCRMRFDRDFERCEIRCGLNFCVPLTSMVRVPDVSGGCAMPSGTGGSPGDGIGFIGAEGSGGGDISAPKLWCPGQDDDNGSRIRSGTSECLTENIMVSD